jgi:prepilin-type N-terminal cleavage/methylation domain-containing protein
MHKQSSIINRQSSMARAFTLIEMLAVVTIAPLLMVLVSGFFRSFLRDIPQTAHMVDQSSIVLDLFDQLRRDTDLAVALPQQVGDKRADDSTLLIEQSEAVVCYRFDEGRITRVFLDKQGGSVPGGDRIWQARDAVLEWRAWMRKGSACAVELHSYLKQEVAGQLRRRFASSNVFFVGGLTSGGASHE